ncbi:uncharacterized protein THITE_2122399 [Thermothielavioides terrestris NRRL 8126]|uniref:Uncharacterized protein n=1 Tax=Thermothielavioides terrestris (strain ATCC 38088 / NRRL 8126) TaxID=578455 RepID=G2RD14_THETT|nr:uncharacterized protein THITE_2122399 [Thermothielavioides terrestris NRRL 8126]AEO70707.1 hypothetical protein THITE_2122399 [Thermothielavioides terrestris NRRL 8126]
MPTPPECGSDKVGLELASSLPLLDFERSEHGFQPAPDDSTAQSPRDDALESETPLTGDLPLLAKGSSNPEFDSGPYSMAHHDREGDEATRPSPSRVEKLEVVSSPDRYCAVHCDGKTPSRSPPSHHDDSGRAPAPLHDGDTPGDDSVSSVDLLVPPDTDEDDSQQDRRPTARENAVEGSALGEGMAGRELDRSQRHRLAD